MKFDILVPSRGRIDRLRNLIQSAVDTADDISRISFYFYFDDDDKGSISGITRLVDDFPQVDIKHKVGPRVVLSEAWNEIWKISDGDICMHCGDDILFESKSWDTLVAKQFEDTPDQLLFVYGDDGIQGPDIGIGGAYITYPFTHLGTHGFISRKSTEILGYFVPPYFAWGLNDTWLNEIYERIGRRVFLSNVVTKHYHHTRYPQNRDQTTRDLINPIKKKESKEIWVQKEPQRIKDSEKLRKNLL